MRVSRCLRTVGADEPEQAVRAAGSRACGEAAVGIVEAAAPQAEEARRPRIDHHQRLRKRACRHQFVVDSQRTVQRKAYLVAGADAREVVQQHSVVGLARREVEAAVHPVHIERQDVQLRARLRLRGSTG